MGKTQRKYSWLKEWVSYALKHQHDKTFDYNYCINKYPSLKDKYLLRDGLDNSGREYWSKRAGGRFNGWRPQSAIKRLTNRYERRQQRQRERDGVEDE